MELDSSGVSSNVLGSYIKYRLTINNPAINIPVPSVFWHEFQSVVSNFPSQHINGFRGRCFCLYFDGAVPRISCFLIPDY